MRLGADAERRRKEEEASLKRQRISEDVNHGYGYPSNAGSAIAGPSTFPGVPPQDYSAAKRRRLQDGPDISATPPPSSSQAITMAGLADFDIRSLKPELVLELIIANLQVMTPERVQLAVQVGFPNVMRHERSLTCFCLRSRLVRT